MVGVIKCADEEEIIIVPTLRKARLEHHFRRQKIGFIGDKMVFGDSFWRKKWFSATVFGGCFQNLKEEKEEEERAKRPKKPRTTENDLRQMLLYFAAVEKRRDDIGRIKQEQK